MTAECAGISKYITFMSLKNALMTASLNASFADSKF